VRVKRKVPDTILQKIYSRSDLVERVAADQKAGERIVFTNGCFDLLHIGHTRYLAEAKGLGDRLVVGINSDDSVRQLAKGTDRPIVLADQRAEVLAALACVDYVTIFDEPDPLALIQALRPNILVKGGDWATNRIVGKEFVEAQGGSVQNILLVPNISTTALVQRILANNPVKSPR
jgi:D-beta-D-heptose 7-phosphate kinase/D-beta-D-heptose 1-phosphate adenosyltransferase